MSQLLDQFPLKLYSPLTNSPLHLSKRSLQTIEIEFLSENQEVFQVLDGVPILLPKSEELNPLLKHYQKDAEVFDYFEERSGATAHDERRVREFILSKITTADSLIVDIGSGRGWVAESLCSKGKTVISLDVTPINIKKALEIFPHPNHFGLVADAHALPFANNSLPCVILSEVIEHIAEPKPFIQSILKKIKPGGKLIVTTPYKEVLKYYLCIHCNQKTPANGHLHSFSEKNLFPLFTSPEETDFQIFIDSTRFGNKLLIFLRTHPLLGFFPFPLWKIFDRIANVIFNKPLHIGLVITKQPKY
ncbi:MAG: class I SAM-dependent methyltransferase [Chloroherpetonaceae bacterium]|nr:class I SAM-dependent methyltransferase [Chloroherpetonaceae bacterium]